MKTMYVLVEIYNNGESYEEEYEASEPIAVSDNIETLKQKIKAVEWTDYEQRICNRIRSESTEIKLDPTRKTCYGCNVIPTVRYEIYKVKNH